MKYHPTPVISLLVICLAGCSSSPVKSGKQGFSGAQMLGVGGAAALGGAGGAALDKKNSTRGALIGAGVTGLLTGIGTAVYNKNQGQRDAELKEQTAREERVKIMNADWYQKTQTYIPDSNETAQQPKETVTDDAGTYEGVPYFKQQREVGTPKGQSVFERPRS